jgi:hypothetical protein
LNPNVSAINYGSVADDDDVFYNKNALFGDDSSKDLDLEELVVDDMMPKKEEVEATNSHLGGNHHLPLMVWQNKKLRLHWNSGVRTGRSMLTKYVGQRGKPSHQWGSHWSSSRGIILVSVWISSALWPRWLCFLWCRGTPS